MLRNGNVFQHSYSLKQQSDIHPNVNQYSHIDLNTCPQMWLHNWQMYAGSMLEQRGIV